MKTYLIFGVIGLLLAGGLYKSIQNGAKWEMAAENLAKTVALQAKAKKINEKINLDSQKRIEELENETSELHEDLGKLATTQVQRDCDSVDTPVGYSERMLKYARDRVPVYEDRRIEVDTD